MHHAWGDNGRSLLLFDIDGHRSTPHDADESEAKPEPSDWLARVLARGSCAMDESSAVGASSCPQSGPRAYQGKLRPTGYSGRSLICTSMTDLSTERVKAYE